MNLTTVVLDEDDPVTDPPPAIAHPPRQLHRLATALGIGASLGLAYFAGASSDPPRLDRETAEAFADQSSATNPTFIETPFGVPVLVDANVLDSPATKEARTLREAANLWAAYVTARLSDEELALLTDPPGPLDITLDAETGQYESVRSVRDDA